MKSASNKTEKGKRLTEEITYILFASGLDVFHHIAAALKRYSSAQNDLQIIYLCDNLTMVRLALNSMSAALLVILLVKMYDFR